MADNPKSFKKTTETKQKPGYRTTAVFKGKVFKGGGPVSAQRGSMVKFNPAQFKTQHKG